ncbi:MAG TPA: IS66 family transposase [Gemmatimonadaceae bacterium]|nr:IS66 family transposase [Gemmatimonadaceae bacterium]
MERAEAEAIYDAGREAVVSVLLAMSEQIAVLTARVEELERQVARNSRNSSKPPSSDPPWAPKPNPKKPSGRKRGGQDGHDGHHRQLYVADRIEAAWPSSCSGCGSSLGRCASGAPSVHQVAELPPVVVEIIEYQLNQVRCMGCETVTYAPLPEGVPRSAFGPRLHALVGTLTADSRVSRRNVRDLLDTVFGCPISLGAVDAMVQRVGSQLQAPYEQAVRYIRGADVLCVDETGWKIAGTRSWVWGAFTPEVGVLRIDPERSADAAERLLAGFTGVVSCDRYGAYRQYDERQLCWAHLDRNLSDLAAYPEPTRSTAETLKAVCDEVFTAWRAYADEHQDRARLRRRVGQIKSRMRNLLDDAASNGRDKKARRIARGILREFDCYWTFASIDGVEPTNNDAERGLRRTVITRKVSFGNQTQRGARTTERLQTAAECCRRQSRSLFTYLQELADAATRGDPAPSLTPA